MRIDQEKTIIFNKMKNGTGGVVKNFGRSLDQESLQGLIKKSTYYTPIKLNQ